MSSSKAKILRVCKYDVENRFANSESLRILKSMIHEKREWRRNRFEELVLQKILETEKHRLSLNQFANSVPVYHYFLDNQEMSSD